MKTNTIKYTRHFKDTEEWIGTEITLEDGDSVETAFKKAKEDVDNARRSFVSQHVNEIPTIQVDREIGFSEETILSCRDLNSLKIYEFLVKQKKYEHLAPAYEKRKRELDTSIP